MGSGYSLSNISSRVPSSKSERNRESRDSIEASRAATQIIPGPISANTCFSGLIPRGKSVTTITKKNSGLRISLLCLNASRKSRFNKLKKALYKLVPNTACELFVSLFPNPSIRQLNNVYKVIFFVRLLKIRDF